MQMFLVLFFIFGISGNALADTAAAREALDAQAYATALKVLEADAKRNRIEERYPLGIMCRDGLGVKRDPAMALKWFDHAGDVDWMRTGASLATGKRGTRQA